MKMLKPKGRCDDMLIIRGVNVFPSQIEHVILSLGMEPNYQIVVDRKNNLDIMTVKIEMSDALFSDSVRVIENRRKGLKTQCMQLSVSLQLLSLLNLALFLVRRARQ